MYGSEKKLSISLSPHGPFIHYPQRISLSPFSLLIFLLSLSLSLALSLMVRVRQLGVGHGGRTRYRQEWGHRYGGFGGRHVESSGRRRWMVELIELRQDWVSEWGGGGAQWL
jgi:hypothetical protein